MNPELARFNMIEQQIRPWDVLDPVVLDLLAAMRREDFVPAAYRSLAFVDTQVPLLPGAQALAEGACMLEPKVEARVLQELKLQRHEKVLEIGTGSGFMAALLAHRSMQVHTLECRPELARAARDALRRNGVLNATVHEVQPAQGARGLAAEGPYDAIVLSGSVAEVPRTLLEQLKHGGRLVAVVGQEPIMTARLLTRTGPAAYAERDLFDTVAPRLLGFAEPSRFNF
ncbi:MAG: protein-L-isoaspartate O-methyltransferase [Rubrivivax sp.]|nr:protein-L-isoaspartate O-methyltransferase [Rubrivivax sp.]